MTTDEERIDLKTNPIPVSDEDRSIPTQIARIDAAIKNRKETAAFIESEISDLLLSREALLKRADEVHITDDANYKIVRIPVYKKNKVDVQVLKESFKDVYDKVMWNIAKTLTYKHNAEFEKYKTFIPQSEVKAVTTDKIVLAKVIPPNTEIEGYDISIVKR